MKKERTFEEEMEDSRAEIGSESVYKDLELKNHKELETKSDLVSEIEKAIKKKKLTQTKAAELLEISQPKLSELLRGHFRGYSIARLMNFLNALDQDVDIIVNPKPRSRRAHVAVYHSHNEYSHHDQRIPWVFPAADSPNHSCGG